MSENTRVDPTVLGLALIAFTLFIVGLVGIGKFANITELTQALGGEMGSNILLLLVGVVLIVLTVGAIKIGNNFVALVFGLVGLIVMAIWGGIGPVGIMVAGAFVVVLAIVAFLVKAPMLVTIVLLLAGILFGFFGAAGMTGVAAYSLVFGICGVLAGLVALYTSVAIITEKLPVI